MRALRFLHVSTLCILVGSSIALYAQDEKRQPEQPQRQEEPRPAGNQGELKAPRQEEARPGNQDKQEQRAEKQQQKEQQKQSREQMKNDRQINTAQQGNARPEGKSAHIPDNKFRSNFGRSHAFVVQRPVVVEGQPGFVYGGYSFVFVDPWPTDWAYTDDCYVDDIDGEYFLFDMLHPGMRIALFVVL
jgi:hypothetical protein